MEEIHPMANQTIDQDFLDLSLSYTELSSFAMKRAMDELGVHRAVQQKAAATRSDVLDYGKKHGFFPEHQLKEAEAMLASHDTTLVLLKQAMELNVKKDAKSTPTEIGGPADEKTAADMARGNGTYNSLTDPYLGRNTGEKKASDIAFEKALTGAPG
jgi:hypothetical protein